MRYIKISLKELIKMHLKDICSNCLGLKSKQSKNCKKCSYIFRRYKKICPECNLEFEGKNQFRKKCLTCDPDSKKCHDCPKILSSKVRTRYNSCNQKFKFKNGIVQRKKTDFIYYHTDGYKFRSKWEVRFYQLLNAAEIEFEYEKYNPATENFPDFYIKELDLYVEFHPDWYGKKRMPKGGILIRKFKHIIPVFFMIDALINGRDNRNILMRLPKRSTTMIYKNLQTLIPDIQLQSKGIYYV